MTLKPATKHDSEALLDIFGDPETVRYTNFRQFTELAPLNDFLDRFLNIGKDEPLQFGPYCIWQDQTIIGLCGAQQQDPTLGISEIWYILRKDYWGKGFAKRAVELLLRECHANHQLKALYAEAVEVNPASWRILEKVGFVQTGEVKQGFEKGDILEDLRCYTYNFDRSSMLK